VTGDGAPAPRLYLSTFPKGLVKLATRVLPLVGHDPRRFGQNGDVDLPRIASWEVTVTTRIQVAPYRSIRERAAACHASQRPLTQSSNPIFRALLQREQAVESFCRVYPAFSRGERLETDLFGQYVGWRFKKYKAPAAAWGLVVVRRSAS
jgi:hypothetical protein